MQDVYPSRLLDENAGSDSDSSAVGLNTNWSSGHKTADTIDVCSRFLSAWFWS